MNNSIGDERIGIPQYDGFRYCGETYRMALVRAIAGGMAGEASANYMGQQALSCELRNDGTIPESAAFAITFADEIIRQLDAESVVKPESKEGMVATPPDLEEGEPEHRNP